MPRGPDWRWPGPPEPQHGQQQVLLQQQPSRGSAGALSWAVVGLVLAAVGVVVVVLGTGLVLLDLVWNGFVYSASAGEEGSTGTAATLVRAGNLFVVAPLVLAAAVCTVVAWVRGRGRDAERGRRVTVWATVLTAAMALLVLATAAVVA